MSLATLKAKIKQTQNISSGGFSLNGGIRNTSYIGKTNNHSKSTYLSNDSSVIKTSAVNNMTLIKSRNKEVPVAKSVGGNNSSSQYTKDLRLSTEICESIADCPVETVYHYRTETFNGFDGVQPDVTGIVYLPDANSIGVMFSGKPQNIVSESSYDLLDTDPVDTTKPVISSTLYIRDTNKSNIVTIENVLDFKYQASNSSSFYTFIFVLSDDSNIATYTTDINTYFNDVNINGNTGIEVEISVDI